MTCCGLTPNDGDHICPACVSDLTRLLAETDSVVEELVSAIPRASLTASYGERVNSSGPLHAPLPINDGALDAHIALDKHLMRYALDLAKETGSPLTKRHSQGLSSYLYTYMGALRRQDWAPRFHRELTQLINACEQASRTAQHKQFAGTCQTQDCGANLYAQPGNDTAHCRTCGTQHDGVQQWRADASRYAKQSDDDILGYPQALSQHLARVHGETVGADYIRVLANRGVLKRANAEEADGRKLRPMYRLGDIKKLLNPNEEAA